MGPVGAGDKECLRWAWVEKWPQSLLRDVSQVVSQDWVHRIRKEVQGSDTLCMLLQVGKWGPLSRKVDLNGNPATVCRHKGKGTPCSMALDIFYYFIASQRAVTSNQHVPELGAEVSLPSQAPWFDSLLCLTGLARLSFCRTQSYTLHSFSHVCTFILHCCSWEIFSTWLQSQFLWSLVMSASGTNESVVRTSANADMCSKLSDSGMTSVCWAY